MSEIKRQFKHELVKVADLKPHPRNYRQHPDDQLEHIVKSIEEHGFYRNVVIAEDDVILAGHGVVKAATKMGLTEVPVIRVPIASDDPKALKILTGDNETSKLGEVDDYLLTEILKEIRERDGLLGTGFDDMMLANLVFVTRPSSEIPDFNAALEWVGLPGYDPEDPALKSDLYLVVVFRKRADRDQFVKDKKIQIKDKRGDRKWSTIWPFEGKIDRKSVKMEGAAK